MGIMWGVAALLCHQGCCEKVCGRCESSVEGGVQALPSLGGTAELLHTAAVTSLHWGTLLDQNTALCSLHSTGRDFLIPGETPHWSS